jgi:hypothetical protein
MPRTSRMTMRGPVLIGYTKRNQVRVSCKSAFISGPPILSGDECTINLNSASSPRNARRCFGKSW